METCRTNRLDNHNAHLVKAAPAASYLAHLSNLAAPFLVQSIRESVAPLTDTLGFE